MVLSLVTWLTKKGSKAQRMLTKINVQGGYMGEVAKQKKA